jgi:hypothetical protein
LAVLSARTRARLRPKAMDPTRFPGTLDSSVRLTPSSPLQRATRRAYQHVTRILTLDSLVVRCDRMSTSTQRAASKASVLGSRRSALPQPGNALFLNVAGKTMQPSPHYHGGLAETSRPDRAGSSQPPAPQDWAAVKDEVQRLYVSEALPLHTVKERLACDYGFKASERMFKDRLKKWG